MAKAKINENEIEEAATEEVVVEEAATEEPKEQKYLVETPVKNYNGTVAGVQFAYGKAEVYEGHILNWFRKKGYKVTAL